MSEQRTVGYRWNLRQVMAKRNLWKTTQLKPLLKSRGIELSNAQVHRLVTSSPARIPAMTFAALCDILDCTPNDLFEPIIAPRGESIEATSLNGQS
jgi:DNA-binding Xre family transcriptional regulator